MLPSLITREQLADALKEAEREFREAQQSGDPERYAKAKARLDALEQAAVFGVQGRA